MSWHPAGFPHGPHPKAMKNINNKTHTNEYAVMIDTRWPLHSSAHMESIEFREYWKSWQS
jgi:homogentisate 1,2-dioxygenase